MTLQKFNDDLLDSGLATPLAAEEFDNFAGGSQPCCKHTIVITKFADGTQNREHIDGPDD